MEAAQVPRLNPARAKGHDRLHLGGRGNQYSHFVYAALAKIDRRPLSGRRITVPAHTDDQKLNGGLSRQESVRHRQPTPGRERSSVSLADRMQGISTTRLGVAELRSG